MRSKAIFISKPFYDYNYYNLKQQHRFYKDVLDRFWFGLICNEISYSNVKKGQTYSTTLWQIIVNWHDYSGQKLRSSGLYSFLKSCGYWEVKLRFDLFRLFPFSKQIESVIIAIFNLSLFICTAFRQAEKYMIQISVIVKQALMIQDNLVGKDMKK